MTSYFFIICCTFDYYISLLHNLLVIISYFSVGPFKKHLKSVRTTFKPPNLYSSVLSLSTLFWTSISYEKSFIRVFSVSFSQKNINNIQIKFFFIGVNLRFFSDTYVCATSSSIYYWLFFVIKNILKCVQFTRDTDKVLVCTTEKYLIDWFQNQKYLNKIKNKFFFINGVFKQYLIT